MGIKTSSIQSLYDILWCSDTWETLWMLIQHKDLHKQHESVSIVLRRMHDIKQNKTMYCLHRSIIKVACKCTEWDAVKPDTPHIHRKQNPAAKQFIHITKIKGPNLYGCFSIFLIWMLQVAEGQGGLAILEQREQGYKLQLRTENRCGGRGSANAMRGTERGVR